MICVFDKQNPQQTKKGSKRRDFQGGILLEQFMSQLKALQQASEHRCIDQGFIISAFLCIK